MDRSVRAPGRPHSGRSGALLLPLLLLVLLGGCQERRTVASDRHRLPLGKDTIDVGPAVSVLSVRLGGPGASTAVHPRTVRARVGDVVRFVAADALGNAVAFQDSALSPDARRFLERTHQLRGPPLINEGASWVVSLEGAPPGRYPFRSLTRASAGELVVEPRAAQP